MQNNTTILCIDDEEQICFALLFVLFEGALLFFFAPRPMRRCAKGNGILG